MPRTSVGVIPDYARLIKVKTCNAAKFGNR